MKVIGFEMIPALMPTYDRYNLTIIKGKGCSVFDSKGKRYLDFGAGIAVNSLGHCHPRLVSALKKQASNLWHCSNLYNIPEQTELAKRLVKNTFADTVFFNNSGAEAIETGIKIIRKYQHDKGNPSKYRIITFKGSFHGRTLATIAASKQKKHIDGFGPIVSGFDQVILNDIEKIESVIKPTTAGILIEPIQGEGGIICAKNKYLQELRRLCDKYDLLLMLDEVQTGNGRTGKLFAYEWAKLKPDIVATAKGLGGGFPIGACLATEQAGKTLTAGSHGTTFGGNPMATAVANAVLDVILKKGFLNSVRDRSALLMKNLTEIVKCYPTVIDEIRGKGLMIGLHCAFDDGNKMLVEKFLKKGLMAVPAGNNVVRLLPPLVVTPSEINEATSIIGGVVSELS